MRFWISGPRLLGRRTGFSFGPEDFRKLSASRAVYGAPPATGPRQSAFVYVVQSDNGHVKIGISANPLVRLASLQTGASTPLSLSYVAAVSSGDGYAIEQASHGILWKHRLSGEWFDTTPDLAVAAVAAASHRLADPIVQIANDKVQFVIDEAARRERAIARPNQRRWLLLWFGTTPIPIMWTVGVFDLDTSAPLAFTTWLVIAGPWFLVSWLVLRASRSSA
jgi:hypothetical protein